MFTIKSSFAVPMAFARIEDCDAMNNSLRSLFLQREAEGGRWANPNPYTHRNRALFESHFDLFKWPEQPVQQLRTVCMQHLAQLVQQINGYDQAYMSKVQIGADAWFHVTRRGGHFGIHNHPMASWSGVYCVAGGNHDAEHPESGQLTFINPFIMTSMFIDAGTAQMKEPFSLTSRSYRLDAGSLVLFPSWLLHEVKPFHGDNERITVAFNCWFHVKQG